MSDFLMLGVVLLVSAVGTVVWSLLDRKRENYTRLYELLYFLVRIFLALNMLGYGVAKVLPMQFKAALTPHELAIPFGDSSPMGVLWKFMTASRIYTISAGLVEMGAGVLLLWPRTAFVGALATFAVMGHVFLLNVSYDVSVKVFSFHLLLLSLFMIGRDVHLLKHLFPARSPAVFKKRWGNRGLAVLGTTLVLLGTCQMFLAFREATGSEHPLYGIWKSSEHPLNQIIFEPHEQVYVQENGEWKRFSYTIDEEKRQVTFDGKPYTFHIEGDTLELVGEVQVKLKRKDLSEFRLVSRGFHIVNETAYNY